MVNYWDLPATVKFKHGSPPVVSTQNGSSNQYDSIQNGRRTYFIVSILKKAPNKHVNICFYKALILWEVKGKKPPYFCRPKFGFLGILPAHFPMNCTHQARSHKWLQKQVSFVHEEEWIIWKNVTSLVLFLLLCNISLNYAIHQYSIHKCIFGEKKKKTLSKFLHNSSKWDFSVKVKSWRNWNAGGPDARYSTALYSRSFQTITRATQKCKRQLRTVSHCSRPPSSFSCKDIWMKALQETHRIDSKASHRHRDSLADRFGGLLSDLLPLDFIPPVT